MKKKKNIKFVIFVSTASLICLFGLIIILSSLAKESNIQPGSEQSSYQENIILTETEMLSRSINEKKLSKPTKIQVIKSTFKLADKNTFL